MHGWMSSLGTKKFTDIAMCQKPPRNTADLVFGSIHRDVNTRSSWMETSQVTWHKRELSSWRRLVLNGLLDCCHGKNDTSNCLISRQIMDIAMCQNVSRRTPSWAIGLASRDISTNCSWMETRPVKWRKRGLICWRPLTFSGPLLRHHGRNDTKNSLRTRTIMETVMCQEGLRRVNSWESGLPHREPSTRSSRMESPATWHKRGLTCWRRLVLNG